MRTLGEQMTFIELPGVLGSVELNPQGPGLSIIVPVFLRRQTESKQSTICFFVVKITVYLALKIGILFSSHEKDSQVPSHHTEKMIQPRNKTVQSTASRAGDVSPTHISLEKSTFLFLSTFLLYAFPFPSSCQLARP